MLAVTMSQYSFSRSRLKVANATRSAFFPSCAMTERQSVEENGDLNGRRDVIHGSTSWVPP